MEILKKILKGRRHEEDAAEDEERGYSLQEQAARGKLKALKSKYGDYYNWRLNNFPNVTYSDFMVLYNIAASDAEKGALREILPTAYKATYGGGVEQFAQDIINTYETALRQSYDKPSPSPTPVCTPQQREQGRC